MSTSRGLHLLVWIAAMSWGCTPDGSFAREASDGTTTPDVDAGVLWSFSDAPVLHAGAGPDGVTFGWVAGATMLSNGGLVVADNMERVLHFFAADGTHLRRVGGRGEGPGEFESISQLVRIQGDTLVVSDQLAHRISFFAPSGDYVRSFRPQSEHTSELALFGMTGTNLLIQVAHARARQEGLSRDTMLLAFADTDSGMVTPLERVLGAEYVVTHTGTGIRMRRAPFAGGTFVATAPDRYAVGHADADSLAVFTSGLDPIFVIAKRGRAPTSVRDTDIWRYYEATRQPGTDRGAYLRRAGNADASPETMPAFDKLIFDGDSNLWVRRFSPPWDTAGAVWDVYDRMGAHVGGIRLPPGNGQLVEVASDYAVVVLKDSSDVESVAVYRLEQPIN
jgi:hypothetical protein